MAKLDCGHISFKGWTQDPEELERLGLLDQKAATVPEEYKAEEQAARLLEAQQKLEYELKQGI
jgi:hypothetical protein